MRNEKQRSNNREREQREDQNPLASTKKLHQRRVPTIDPVAKLLRKTIKIQIQKWWGRDGGRIESMDCFKNTEDQRKKKKKNGEMGVVLGFRVKDYNIVVAVLLLLL